ncbi:hypothetical protein BD311DRAFT_516949 [Dichomitus squalens]|uniref:Uncharacterized protein n=1 Tax=Dichomitus squalens TaxID=114155 RepID=A0A4Q9N2L1_9APHY|nr:hypothetical protein BD311DRAFT_516949 [Dichomitus squalens]
MLGLEHSPPTDHAHVRCLNSLSNLRTIDRILFPICPLTITLVRFLFPESAFQFPLCPLPPVLYELDTPAIPLVVHQYPASSSIRTSLRRPQSQHPPPSSLTSVSRLDPFPAPSLPASMPDTIIMGWSPQCSSSIIWKAPVRRGPASTSCISPKLQ